MSNGVRGWMLIVLLPAGCAKSTGVDAGVLLDAAAADVVALDAPALDAVALDAVAPDAAPDAGFPDADPPPDTGPAGTPYVYVGSSNGNISAYRLDPAAGTLTPLGTTPAGANPSFLAFSPSRRHLYAVNEGGANGMVASFAIDPSNGSLTFLNRVSSEGSGPAHLSVDNSGRYVVVANYGDGAIAVLPILADGSLGAATDSETPGDNAHLIITDPANRFAFVPCLGSNYVAQFIFDAANGTVTANAVATVPSEAGAGPRHLAFHPGALWAYVINERNSTITKLDYDAAGGRLTPGPSVTTLPANFGGNNTTAEIVVHPNGRFVFGSNRGHDSIATFSVDQNSGELTLLAHTLTGGMTPRNFGLTPDGELLLAANQRSDTIHAFRVDSASGELTPLGEVAQVNRPAFVGALLLP